MSLASDSALLERLRNRFAGREGTLSFPEFVSEPTAMIPAAVLLPVVLHPTGITVLLTKRTEHLRDHAGQISFPGGRCETSDLSPIATALREAQEEIGLRREQIDVLGILPQFSTGTGFVITPVVGLVTPPLELTLDEFEVDSVFEPPLEFLLDGRNHQRSSIDVNGATRQFWAVPWNEHYIWGATAGMLVNLRQFLFTEESL